MMQPERSNLQQLLRNDVSTDGKTYTFHLPYRCGMVKRR